MFSRAGECPFVCIGQQAIQIGAHLINIAVSTNFYKPTVCGFTDDLKEDHNKLVTFLGKCSHFGVEYHADCSSCAVNCQSVEERLISLLHNPKFVTLPERLVIIYDLCSKSGLTTLDHTISFVSSNFPHISIVAVMLKPYYSIYGIDVYYAIMALQLAVSMAAAVMIRGNEDSVDSSYKDEYVSYGQISLADSDHRIAADLWAGFGPSDRMSPSTSPLFIQWPLDTCSMYNKIIDVRSSMYRSLEIQKATTTTTKRKVEYHSLRSMAANIRVLHNFYCSQYTHFLGNISAASKRATGATASSRASTLYEMGIGAVETNYTAFTVGADKTFHFINSSERQTADVQIALKSAAPDLKWPFEPNSVRGAAAEAAEVTGYSSIYNASVNMSGLSTTQRSITGKTNLSTNNATFASSMSNSISNRGDMTDRSQRPVSGSRSSVGIAGGSSSSGSAGKKLATGKGQVVPVSSHSTVSAINFQSPYAVFDILDICRKAKSLLKRGAYLHL